MMERPDPPQTAYLWQVVVATMILVALFLAMLVVT